ncbi:hypothetical protein ASPACDRAFT_1854309 [Aspergillus aculeatus ATCC 16872]|uniref:Zn(2)-C6 fungal-type domain-containing protein n=1 Tax=Aspergillus aculeatus (strain ATCC 16872 / CBS 172.66 / WB 5094) TaxID=690307 RepID=A0A1L9X1E2_ASPA1|nr:uncharacterized protein ASPACDRAFT_1854309 [Aspergillus aculeatus ATCC 16872]OJK02327.1 hypothetical protein ASPACDRAFT_1854309 [Aspergillus aculeatus ATCC 16872]
MVKKAELRRSCTFCRARKIACSGERICTACRDRSIECVYGLEGAKGRPCLGKTSPGIPPAATAAFPAPTTAAAAAAAAVTITTTSLAAELDIMFRENFSDGDSTTPVPSNIFQDRVATFNRRLMAGRANSPQRSASAPTGSISYPGLLALAMQELIETVAVKFSNLGCHPFFGPGESFYHASMLQDTTKAMFDSPPASSSDLDIWDDYNPHLISQYLEIWFSNHPLSILISKSLLLRDLRSQKANRILLAILLADAHHFAEESVKGDRLVQWAIAQLPSAPAGKGDLTTAQSLLLLGWYHACRGRSRRALCYVGYAGRIITTLKCQLSESSLAGQTHINGVDHGAVEAELIHNICWVMLALTLWSYIQMDMPLLDLLPARLMQVLPASSEAESMLLQLDRATENLSTLKSQSSSLQSVWLLAHVTSLSARLYAVYPRPQCGSPVPQPWQESILHRLDRLLHQGRSLAQVCAGARDALLDVVATVQHGSGDCWGGPILLIFYQAVALHLLFPRKEMGNDTAQVLVLSDSLFQRLTTSMHDLKQLFPAIQAFSQHHFGHAANTVSASLHFYMLGLDAVSRALMYMLTLWDRATTVEQQLWRDRLSRLLEMGLRMQELFDHETLLKDCRWRAVKRQLKTACSRLEGVVSSFRDQSSHGFSGALDLNLPLQQIPAARNPTTEPMSSSSSLVPVAHDTDFEWLDLQDVTSPPTTASNLRDFGLASLANPIPILSLNPFDSLPGVTGPSCMVQPGQTSMPLSLLWDDAMMNPISQSVGVMPSPPSVSLGGLGPSGQESQRKRSSNDLSGVEEGDAWVEEPKTKRSRELRSHSSFH